ncbi:hypothetical protein F4774DRAFT_405933 [Daldinia eschscholtzii]|nr:hypothetical protein F4774DRAFT_405933 [Daldinia eschscholtzii]
MAFLGPLAALAAPQSEIADDHRVFLFEDFYGQLDDNGNKIPKRGISGPNLLRRKSDYVSSCGSQWVPVGDFANVRSWVGYNSAVDAFCQHITTNNDGKPTVVGPRAYTGTTVRTNSKGEQIGLDGGKNPEDANTNIIPGHIEFEIHNKQSTGDHIPDLANCRLYLGMMTRSNANGYHCYGEKNKDTKGGTWQVGSDQISYHALPGKN